MPCCSGGKWKREVVQDHKFDFVDIQEYHATGFFSRFQYFLVYVFVIKSVLVYISDIYTAVAMLANNYWSGNILSESDNSSTIKVPFTIGKWIFTGCIIFSFLLLAWESRKARMIIRSRDISYAFTNVMANNYYTLKSYDHFCFFSQINNSKKKKDEFAFFVFFTFKGWKRLLLADAPRQVINGLTLYSFGKAFDWTTDLSKYYNDSDGQFSLVRAGVLCTMIFTVVVWCGSAILLAIAALMYIPLLCYIQGNLKEYCCHKIDKRIAELMKKKTKKRLAKEAELAKREAAGDFRHLQDKKGRFKDGRAPLPQPTLPSISLDDSEMYAAKSEASFGGGSRKGGYSGGYPGNSNNYPPLPHLLDNNGYGNGMGHSEYPRYALSDAGGNNESSYSLAQMAQGRNAGYPYPSNDSLPSFSGHGHGNGYSDDKASIRSKGGLDGGYYGAAYGEAEGDPQQHGAGQSQISLTRAPSYKTREGGEESFDAEQGATGSVYDFGKAYQYANAYSAENQGGTQQQGYFDAHYAQGGPDPQHPLAEPPYAMDHESQFQPQQGYASQSHSHHNAQDGYAYAGHGELQPVNFSEQHSMARNPTARGISVAGRSDITTFYGREERDRASMADSHAGAFDLDDYARSSLFQPAGHGAQGWHTQFNQQRENGRLDQLEEEVDEDAHQQYGYRQQHHQQGYQHQQAGYPDQRDWRR